MTLGIMCRRPEYRSRALRAFSLLELLAVIVIIGVLGAIVFPIVASSKKSALRTQCISNLHQCGLALAMYGDGGLESVPTYRGASQAIPSSVTCDPEDHLRADCKVELGKPVIGSYAYVRGLDGLDDTAEWSKWLQLHPKTPIMICPHHGDGPLKLFDGNENNPCIQTGECIVPNRVTELMMDTSAHSRMLNIDRQPTAGHNRLLFTWDALFELR